MKTKQVQTRWSDRSQHFCWDSHTHPPSLPSGAADYTAAILNMLVFGMCVMGMWKSSPVSFLGVSVCVQDAQSSPRLKGLLQVTEAVSDFWINGLDFYQLI